MKILTHGKPCQVQAFFVSIFMFASLAQLDRVFGGSTPSRRTRLPLHFGENLLF